MTMLYGFDFGETTGISVGFYDDKTAYDLLRVWEVPGGTEGLKDWWKSKSDYKPRHGDRVVAEKFVLNPGNPFTADLSGVPAEGALAALWEGELVWQPRDAKAGVPDSLLKAHGLWQGPLDGHEDGRDANDAIIHSIELLRRESHRPTLRKYFGPRIIERTGD